MDGGDHCPCHLLDLLHGFQPPPITALWKNWQNTDQIDKHHLNKLNMGQKRVLTAKKAKWLQGYIRNNADNRLKKIIILCSTLVRLYLECDVP